MLHFIEDRIEQKMLRAGTHQLAQLVDALRDSSPNRNAWRHVGVLVARAEPLAQATFRALAIVIEREVDALRYWKRRGVALRFFEEAAQHRALLDEVRRRGGAGAHPSVAVAHRAPQRDLVARAEPNRRMRLLKRLGFH